MDALHYNIPSTPRFFGCVEGQILGWQMEDSLDFQVLRGEFKDMKSLLALEDWKLNDYMKLSLIIDLEGFEFNISFNSYL